MRGDLPDMIFRLAEVLPQRWFSDKSPNLHALLKSLATPWVWINDLIGYVVRQTRLATATDFSLEIIAHDYFGSTLRRKTNEADTFYRARIQAALQRQFATRAAVSAGLQALTGTTPEIFEPGRCQDTGCYGTLFGASASRCYGLAYGQAGGWGSLVHPLQFFVTVARPPTPTVSMLAGYGSSKGGYGLGAISYIDLGEISGYITDQDIQSTLVNLLPVNAIAWLRII